MEASEALRELGTELEKAVALDKCRKCECIKGSMRAIHDSLAFVKGEDARELERKIPIWLEEMGPSEYT